MFLLCDSYVYVSSSWAYFRKMVWVMVWCIPFLVTWLVFMSVGVYVCVLHWGWCSSGCYELHFGLFRSCCHRWFPCVCYVCIGLSMCPSIMWAVLHVGCCSCGSCSCGYCKNDVLFHSVRGHRVGLHVFVVHVVYCSCIRSSLGLLLRWVVMCAGCSSCVCSSYGCCEF